MVWSKKPSHATVPLRPEYMYLALRAAKTAKVGRKTAAECAGLSQYTRDSRVIAIFFSATDIDIRFMKQLKNPDNVCYEKFSRKGFVTVPLFVRT